MQPNLFGIGSCDCEALPFGRWSEQVSRCSNTRNTERLRDGFVDVTNVLLIKTSLISILQAWAEALRHGCRWPNDNTIKYAGVAELADVPDLGSGVFRRAGSTPVARTIKVNIRWYKEVISLRGDFLFAKAANPLFTGVFGFFSFLQHLMLSQKTFSYYVAVLLWFSLFVVLKPPPYLGGFTKNIKSCTGSRLYVLFFTLS